MAAVIFYEIPSQSSVIGGLLIIVGIVYSGSVVKTNFYAIYNESGVCMFYP